MAARKKAGARNPRAKSSNVHALRIDPEMVDRVDALVPALAESRPELAALGRGGVTRSVVLRLAILRGLDALERETRRR